MTYQIPKCECGKNTPLILSITETNVKDFEIKEDGEQFKTPICEVLETRMTRLFCHFCGNVYELGLNNAGQIVRGEFIEVMPQYL